MREQPLTPGERLVIVRRRIHNLRVFTENFNEKCPAMVEIAAYNVLEVYRSRPRAIIAYALHMLKEWACHARVRLLMRSRFLWYRKVQRLELDAALIKLDRYIEGKIFTTGKGTANGK